MVPPEAVAAQGRSSDPAASVWVSANAGAGKTYVLAQRVVRLLLSGVEPGAILCLTFTNAAAAEMAGRVFKELATLATLPNSELAHRVAVLAPNTDSAEATQRARTLFARTLETPGGLKVSTIHAFAAALLRRFPLEANVSGAFQILDDPTRNDLIDRAIAATLAEAAENPAGDVAAELSAAIPHVADASLPDVIRAFLGERDTLTHWLAGGTSSARLTAHLKAALAFDDRPIAPSTMAEADWRRLHEAWLESGADKRQLPRLEAAVDPPAGERDRVRAEALLTAGATPKKLPKKVLSLVPDLTDTLEVEAHRLAAVVVRERAAAVIEGTVPLAQLAYPVQERLEAEKRRRGFVDYDDQIETAMNLVKTEGAAEWVRYKLDEGIDHVMLDEAQDTSPAQWDLVDALTGEFYAGAGARQAHRTVFVVGDEKQSIYSFQGAAPHLFGEKRDQYSSLAAGAEMPFAPVALSHSFRSAPQVLAAVDRVFQSPARAAAIGAGAGGTIHRPTVTIDGGVDVWPLLSDDEAETPDAWDAPLDATSERTGEVKLAWAIADQIEAWAQTGPDGGAPVDPGNVMILSRNRGRFAGIMNRELKARGIPAAGSDRLDVTKHIAVQDLLALARALVATDDLSLAAALKSPLFGFSEEELFHLAHGRDQSLFDALASGDSKAQAAHRTLTRWRRAALTERPFDFFARLLISEGRRGDFAARLGSEAEDALDAFLHIALSAEAADIAAMDPFLQRLTRLKAEIRRAAENSGGKVRVMTVHGAKGLEAEVVFLADIGQKPGRSQPPTVMTLPMGETEEVLAKVPRKEDRPAPIAEAVATLERNEAAEHDRLLYVGMTRAERHLVMCGAYRTTKPKAGMWHGVVWDALAPHASPTQTPAGEGISWRTPAATGPAPAPADKTAKAAPPEPPHWLRSPPPARPSPPEPIVPSEHHDAAKTAGEDDRVLPAAQHGILVHALLERSGDTENLKTLARQYHPELGERVDHIVHEVLGALALPQLAVQPDELHREVSLIGDVVMEDGKVRRALARVDRVQLGDETLIVDFKTDRPVPANPSAAPPSYGRQLAIYRALLSAQIPGPISTAIVWTAGPVFMTMDAELPPIRPHLAPR
ncbi:MAG: double-strand break repair helicase AddA [Pseudomonadota bacterium]